MAATPLDAARRRPSSSGPASGGSMRQIPHNLQAEESLLGAMLLSREAIAVDVEAAVDRAETLIFEVAQRRVTDTIAPLHDLLEKSLDRLEALYGRAEGITGVPTGYVDLDEQLSGLQPGSLVIVGARPSMGKA